MNIKSLDTLIQYAQVSGCIDVQCQFQGDWFLKSNNKNNKPGKYKAVVHIVVEGEGFLKIKGEKESHLLKAGDLVFFTRSAEHILSSQYNCDNSANASELDKKQNLQLKLTEKGMGKSDLRLFCAHFSYDKYASLFHSLPEYLWTTLESGKLRSLLYLLQAEVESQEDKSQLVIDSLSNVLLVEILRSFLATDPENVEGILKGVQDPRLAILVNHILANPADNWSVDRMAEKSNFSRAQLMRVFKSKIGVSPHAFVHQIRLQYAAKLLNASASSVFNIALSAGFQSEAHFIQAFKKMYKVTPSQYRKQA